MLFRKGTGCLHDPKDDRDQLFGSYVGIDKVLGFGFLPVPPGWTRNQRRTNRCVGYAVAGALRLASKYQRAPELPELSANYIYAGARAYHSTDLDGDGKVDLVDEGSNIRSGMKSVIRMGAASEKACPSSALRVNKSPPFIPAVRDGLARRGLRKYFRCRLANEVRQAIDMKAPVVGGWPMHESWGRAYSDIAPPFLEEDNGRLLGNHAMVVIGYNEDGSFDIWNTSWTEGFGYKGVVRVSEKVMMTGFDFWAVML